MILTQRDSPFIVSYFKQLNTFFSDSAAHHSVYDNNKQKQTNAGATEFTECTVKPEWPNLQYTLMATIFY